VPEISIVIVSYRTPEHLRRCLRVLASDSSRRSREILVVDNDSGDESAELARSFDGVRVIETGENLGFAGGVNRGLAEATGRFITIMNPDVEVRPEALDTLADFLEAHPESGIVAPKLLNPDGTLQYSCRRFYTLTTLVLRRTVLGRLFPGAAPLRRHLMLDYDHASPRAVDWVAGAMLMVRREALDDVGPMDDRYFLYFEDVDWCTRMQARGWLVHYVPEATVIHHWQRASRNFGSAARRHLGSGLRFFDRWSGFLLVLRQYAGLWRTVSLVGVDLVVVTAAFLGAYAFRQQMAFIFHKPVWALSFYTGFFVASVLVYVAAFSLQGLYREIREGDWVDVAFRVGKGATLGALILMASTFVLDMRSYSRLIVIGMWPLAALLAFAGRRGLYALFARARRDRWTLRRVALLGEDPAFDRLERILRENPELGWEPVRVRRTPWRGRSGAEAGEQMAKRLAGERVSEAVVSPESLGVSEENLLETVLPLRRAGFGVRVVSSFLAGLPPRARLERVGEVPWLTLERPALRPARPQKRAFDLVGASLLALAGLVPFLGRAAVRAISRRPLRGAEERWRGRWGEVYRVRPLAGAGWLRLYPLLGGVLRGRFSLVGLRPLGPGETVPGGESWLRVREHHRPGLVGPWSLVPAPTPEEEMQQELRYLEDWSPELDLKLLARVALRRPRRGGGKGSASPVTRAHPNGDATPATTPSRAQSMGIPT
jgi:N-acetylglucosaminyl-diphospho-decaprenol L-rhamnosyltransferase